MTENMTKKKDKFFWAALIHIVFFSTSVSSQAEKPPLLELQTLFVFYSDSRSCPHLCHINKPITAELLKADICNNEVRGETVTMLHHPL